MFVGIEIAPDALRAVSLARCRPAQEPERTLEIPIEAGGGLDNAAGLDRAVSALVDEWSLDGREVAVSVPSTWCFYRSVAFPFRQAARVERTLPYAVESRLPGNVDDYVVEPLGEPAQRGGQGCGVLVAACAWERVARVLEAFEGRGVQVAVLQPAIASIHAWATARAMPAGDRGAMIVRVARGTCEFALAGPEGVRACRAMPCADKPDPDEIASAARITLRAWRLDVEGLNPESVILMAADESRAELGRALEKSLRLPVSAPSVAGTAPEYAAAWGAACDWARRRHAATSLRRGDYAYSRFAKRAERRVWLALALACCIMVLAGVQIQRARTQARQDLDAARERLARAFLSGGGRPGETVSLDIMKSRLAQLRKEITTPGPGKAASCVRLWVALMQLARDYRDMRFETIDINQSRILVTGTASDRSRVMSFRERLKSSDVFQPRPPAFTKKSKSGETAFTLELRYR